MPKQTIAVDAGMTRRARDPGLKRVQIAGALVVLLFVALAGCQSPAPVTQPSAQPVPEPEAAPPPPAPVTPAPAPVPTPGERALADGVALYEAGDFNGAIKQLRAAKEIWTDNASPAATANKVAAHKYLAFSYCVTKRPAQCRQQFVDALKLDAEFTLASAEKSHPMWGPEFERAKKQASAPAPAAKRKGSSAATASNPAKAPATSSSPVKTP